MLLCYGRRRPCALTVVDATNSPFNILKFADVDTTGSVQVTLVSNTPTLTVDSVTPGGSGGVTASA